MSETIRILKEARKLLTKKSRWIQGMAWATKKGKRATKSTATCFCLEGSLYKVADYQAVKPAYDALMDNLKRLTNRPVPPLRYWNDRQDTSHGDVLNLLDTTIENLITMEGK